MTWFYPDLLQYYGFPIAFRMSKPTSNSSYLWPMATIQILGFAHLINISLRKPLWLKTWDCRITMLASSVVAWGMGKIAPCCPNPEVHLEIILNLLREIIYLLLQWWIGSIRTSIVRAQNWCNAITKNNKYQPNWRYQENRKQQTRGWLAV